MNLTGIKLAVPAGVLFVATFVLWRTEDSVLVGLPSTVLALVAMNIVSLAFAIVYVVLRNRQRPERTGQ